VRLLKLHAGAYAATKERLRGPGLDALRGAISQDVADWTARFGQH
jgi:hypothetical protein